jgi:hypothetical protein
MTRLTAVLSAVSLFTVVPAMPSPALAATVNADSGIIDHCVSTFGKFPEETLGNCIAVLTTADRYFSGTGGAGFIAQICSFQMKSFPDHFYAVYDSYDECIVDGASGL